MLEYSTRMVRITALYSIRKGDIDARRPKNICSVIMCDNYFTFETSEGLRNTKAQQTHSYGINVAVRFVRIRYLIND
jgi:hypothetical protein